MTTRCKLTILTAVAALALLPSAALAGGTTAQSRADTIRGEALNALYGNAVTRLSPEAFAAIYDAGGWRMTPAELNALVTRGEGLNALARSGVYARPASPVPGGSSFAWGGFAIGAGAAVGLMLIGLGLSAVVRTGARRRVGLPSS